MSENGTVNEIDSKPRVLCLHGFRTSAKILQNLIISRWPETALASLDLVFVDAPFPSEGRSAVEGIYDPPYFEWFQSDQGAVLAAALPGMQKDGVALGNVPTIKSLIIISGAKFGGYSFGLPKLAVNAFSSPVDCPSLHIIGDADFMKDESEALLSSFVDPVVIYHPRGHTVPRFDEEDVERLLKFIENIRRL